MIKIDDNLRAIVGGHEEYLRTPDMVKRLWVYIKEHDLKMKKED